MQRHVDLSYVIQKTCTDKVGLSLEEADRYIDQSAVRGIIYYYYKCQFCMRYHISKNEKTEEKIGILGGKLK